MVQHRQSDQLAGGRQPYHLRDRPRGVKLGGNALANVDASTALRRDSRGWYYDGVNNILWVRFPDQSAAGKVLVEK